MTAANRTRVMSPNLPRPCGLARSASVELRDRQFGRRRVRERLGSGIPVWPRAIAERTDAEPSAISERTVAKPSAISVRTAVRPSATSARTAVRPSVISVRTAVKPSAISLRTAANSLPTVAKIARRFLVEHVHLVVEAMQGLGCHGVALSDHAAELERPLPRHRSGVASPRVLLLGS